jgi:hypothetical protein
MIVAYTAEPCSAKALGLLASWAATEEAGGPDPKDPEAHQARRDGR